MVLGDAGQVVIKQISRRSALTSNTRDLLARLREFLNFPLKSVVTRTELIIRLGA